MLRDEPPRIDMRRLTTPEELICDLYDGTKQGAGATGTAAEIPAGISSVNGGDGSLFKRNYTRLRRTILCGASTSYDLSSSPLRTIPFCHSRLPDWKDFNLTESPLLNGSR